MITYGCKMHYALSFAKGRFAAVSESTKVKKVRREWGMFPLLKDKSPQTLFSSPLYKGKELPYPLEMDHHFILQWICKLILNLSQMLPVTMQCFQFSGFFKKCKHSSYVSFYLAKRLHFSFSP